MAGVVTFCSTYLTSLFYSPPVAEKGGPEPIPTPGDGAETTAAKIALVKESALTHLAKRGFSETTDSIFPKDKRKVLFEIERELQQHQCGSTMSRICCWLPREARRTLPTEEEMNRSPWVEACCTSREGRWAMIVGFVFGCSSGLVATFVLINPSWLPVVLGGILGGAANGGGTYLTLVDSAKRMKALDKKQDLHGIFLRFFNQLAFYLLEKHETEKTRAEYRPGMETETTRIAFNIIANKTQINESVKEFFADEEEKENGLFDQFFQVCSYIESRDSEKLTHDDLKERLRTFNSAKAVVGLTKEIEELKREGKALEAMVKDLQAELSALQQRVGVGVASAAKEGTTISAPAIGVMPLSLSRIEAAAAPLSPGGIRPLPAPPPSSGRRAMSVLDALSVRAGGVSAAPAAFARSE